MSIPSLSIIASAADSTADILVVGVTKTQEGPLADGFESQLLTRLGVTGAPEQLSRHVDGDRDIAFIGLGERVDADSMREAAGSAVRQLAGTGSVAIAFPAVDEAQVRAALEGAALGAYSFDAHKSSVRHRAADASRLPVQEVAVVSGDATVTESTVRTASITAEAVHRTRDLANTPPNVLFPGSFVDIVTRDIEGTSVTVDVLDEARLAEGGFGGILGVGQGSTRPPRLVVLEHAPAAARRHVAIVGKGITFDSGGLSLKPAASMVGMKHDMAGAASAYAIVMAAARLQLPIRVTAYLCLAENMPSAAAMRPDDVITMRGGTTVEVTNTDAEGRLVMADGIVLASESHPDVIVDIATLTGAQVVALGTRVSGVMGNDDQVTTRFIEAGRGVGEQLWHMPIPADLRATLDSPVADIANAKVGNRAAGMLVAASFLSSFVGERADGSSIPWVHVDIAGPSNNEGSPHGSTPAGATGVAVRGTIAAIAALAAERD